MNSKKKLKDYSALGTIPDIPINPNGKKWKFQNPKFETFSNRSEDTLKDKLFLETNSDLVKGSETIDDIEFIRKLKERIESKKIIKK